MVTVSQGRLGESREGSIRTIANIRAKGVGFFFEATVDGRWGQKNTLMPV